MFGLTFSNPGMLYGLGAALLPLVIHLLNRRRTVTVPFSNVALLQALQHDRMRRVKLRQVLLLVLRTLLVLALVLAFARPTLRGAETGSAGGGTRTAAVLVLDRSLSMQYRTPKGTLFDRARGRAREALGLFDAHDDVALLPAASGAEAVLEGEPERLRRHLDGLQPAFGGTDLGAALKQALARLRASGMLNRELFVFTDLGRNGWAALPDSLPGAEGVSVFLVPERPLRPHNLGIRRAAPAGQILTVGTPATLEVELVNYGEAPQNQVPVQVALGERRIAQQVAQLPGASSKRLYIRFTPETGGAVPLRVEIGDDDLTADNTYTTVLNIPEQVEVLLVGETSRETYYLRQALSAASYARGTVRVREVDPGALASGRLDGADAVVLCNVPRLSRKALSALKRRVEAGVGLMICLGDRVDVRFYNDQLLPALFPASLIAVVGVPGEPSVYHSLQTPLPDHALFQDMVQSERFQSPRFAAFYRVRPGEGVRPVLGFGNGAPALVEGRLGAGRTLLFSSGLDPDLKWSDFPVTGFFVPFIHRVCRYLAAGAFGNADYEVGAQVVREVRDASAREAHLRPPQGEAQTIWPEQRGAQSVWPVGEVGVPGLWEVYARERLADRFAVHIPEDESDLTPVAQARVEGVFRGGRVQVVAPEAALSDVVLKQRHGWELWRVFLGLALGLAVAEMLIARPVQTSRGQAAGEARRGFGP